MALISMFDFWSRHAWRAQPLRAAFILAVLVSALVYLGRFASPHAARFDMVLLPSELLLYETAVAAAGGDEVKARALLGWPWPQVCSPETDEERLRRAASTVLCFRGSLDHDRVESVVDSYLRSSGLSVAALRGVPGVAPAASCDATATFEPYGPDAAACIARVNVEAPHPTSTNATMKALLQLGLTRARLRDEALSYAHARPARGLNLFSGGEEIGRWGLGRDSIMANAILREGLAEPLRLAQLQERALSAFTVERGQSDSAEKVGEQIGGYIGSRLSQMMTLGGTTALFLVSIVLLWRARAPARGWRRVLITAGMLLLSLAFVSPEALRGMRLEEAQRVTSGDEGVLAGLFGFLSQLLDVIGAAFATISSAATLECLAMSALFYGIFFAERSAIVAMSFLGLATIPHAFATGQPTLLPVDLRAFDSATALPTLTIVVGTLATLLPATATRGIWIAIGERVLALATGALESALSRRDEADDDTPTEA